MYLYILLVYFSFPSVFYLHVHVHYIILKIILLLCFSCFPSYTLFFSFPISPFPSPFSSSFSPPFPLSPPRPPLIPLPFLSFSSPSPLYKVLGTQRVWLQRGLHRTWPNRSSESKLCRLSWQDQHCTVHYRQMCLGLSTVFIGCSRRTSCTIWLWHYETIGRSLWRLGW